MLDQMLTSAHQSDWIIDGRFGRLTTQSIKEAMLDPRIFWGGTALVILSSYGLPEEIQTRLETHKIPYLFLPADDVRETIAGRSFTPQMALQIKAFIDQLPEEIRYLHFCCDAGQSRSVALGAAWLRKLCADRNDLPVWMSLKQPNPLVYRIMAEVLGVAVTQDELEFRIHLNQAALRQAIDAS